MSVEEELKKNALANSGIGFKDRPGTEKSSDYFQQLETNRLYVEARQAKAAGLITDDEFDRWVSGDKSNVLQRFLQLDGPAAHNTGGTLETIGDVLSLPNYLVASISKGVTEGIKGDNGIDLGLFKVGFSGDAFINAWQNKTDYIKMFDEYGVLGEEGSTGNFVGGLAADILLDPTNVLTLGVSTGTKIALRDGSELASKVLARNGATGLHAAAPIAGVDATLTRFGSKIYRLAARDLERKFALRNGSRLNELGENLTFVDEMTAREFHQEIGDYMVDNFDKLKAEAARITQEGRHGVLSRLSTVVPGSEVQQDLAAGIIKSMAGERAEKLLSMEVDDLFQETATLAHRELGIPYNVSRIQKVTAEIPGVGKHFAKMYDVFDHGWDAPPEVVALHRQYQATVKMEEATAFKDYDKFLGGDTVEDLEMYTRMVEARGHVRVPAGISALKPTLDERGVLRVTETGGDFTDFKTLNGDKFPVNAAGQTEVPLPKGLKDGPIGAFAPLSPKVEAKVRWLEEQFALIEKAEQDAGLKDFGHIEGYIARIYKDPRAAEVVRTAIQRNGEINIKSANRFHHHRMIASINQVEELFDGNNPLVMNALDILKSRKRASINLIATDAFLAQVSKKHGYSEKILTSLRNPLPDGIIRGLMRRAAVGSTWVSSIDQVWSEGRGNLAKLGFKENQSVQNRRLLEYLQQEPTENGRFSESWAKFAEENGVSKDARLHPKTIPTELAWDDLRKERNLQGGGAQRETQSDRPRFSVNEVLKWIDDPNHPAWQHVMSESVSGEGFSVKKMEGLIKALDSYTMKHLDTPLEGFDPRIRGKLEQVIWKRLDLSGGKQVTDVNDYAGTFLDEGKKRVEQLNDLFDSLSAPREVRKLEPQLPTEFVDLLAAQRRQFGVFTDTAPVSEFTEQNIQKQAARLGLSADNLRDINRRLFNKDTYESTQEAHAVERILMGEVYGVERATQSKTSVVEMTFTVNRKNSVSPETLPTQGIPTREARIPKGSAAGEAMGAVKTAANQAGEVQPQMAGVLDGPAYRAATGGEDVALSGSKSTSVGRAASAKTEKIDKMKRLQQEHVVESLDEYHQRRTQIQDLFDVVRNYETKIGDYNKAREAQKVAKAKLDAAPARSAERKAARESWKNAVTARKAAATEVKNAGESLRPLRVTKAEPKGGFAQFDAKLGKTTTKSNERLVANEISELKDVKARLQKETKLLKDWERKQAKVGEGSFNAAPNGRPVGESKTGGIEAGKVKIRDREVLDEAGQHQGWEGYNLNEKTYTHRIITDEGTAKVIRDLMKPDIDPLWPEAAKRLVLGYDKITSYYKANLLLPWTGSWMKNGLGNVAMAYLKAGADLFHPKHAKDYWHGFLYVMDKYSDIGTGMGFDTSKWAAFGEELVTTTLGQTIKMKDLIDEAAKVGVFSTQIGEEVLKAPSVASRFGSGLSGAAAGALAGQGVGSLGEAIGQATSGQEPEGGWFSAANLGSTMGLVAGAYLGARKMRTRPEFGGTQALRSTDWWSGVMQNNWKPFLRAGESATEMPVRLALFVNQFKQTGSVSEAAEAVYAHLNDWNNLSVTERRYVRRAIPFYSWTKHAFKQTGHVLAEHPERLVNILKGVRDWNNHENVDPEDVPDYLQDRLVMATDILGTKWALGGIGMPIETVADVARVLPGSLDANKEMIEAVDTVVRNSNFMLQSGMELMMNRDSYTGEAIDSEKGVFTTRFMDGEKWETSPMWLKKLVGYKPASQESRAVVNPMVAWVLGEVPVSRFINVSKQIYETDDPGNLNYEALARTVLGTSIVRIDPATGQYFIDRARNEKMKNLLTHVGVLRTFEGFADVNKDDEDYSVSGKHRR